MKSLPTSLIPFFASLRLCVRLFPTPGTASFRVRRSRCSRALILGLLASLSVWGTAVAHADEPPVDPQTGVVHSRRLASGVPLGGIGCGAFEMLTDGTISHATLTNNWNAPTGD